MSKNATGGLSAHATPPKSCATLTSTTSGRRALPVPAQTQQAGWAMEAEAELVSAGLMAGSSGLQLIRSQHLHPPCRCRSRRMIPSSSDPAGFPPIHLLPRIHGTAINPPRTPNSKSKPTPPHRRTRPRISSISRINSSPLTARCIKSTPNPKAR